MAADVAQCRVTLVDSAVHQRDRGRGISLTAVRVNLSVATVLPPLQPITVHS